MQCSACGMLIDDDSYYCDQCGTEILVCPECGKTGTHKYCTQHKVELIKARDVNKKGTGQEEVYEMHLINNVFELDLKILTEAVIGSRDGTFVKELEGIKNSKFQSVKGEKYYNTLSGKHLKTYYDNLKSCWMVMDYNSKSGTYYKDIQLKPNIPYKIENGNNLQIGAIIFKIEVK